MKDRRHWGASTIRHPIIALVLRTSDFPGTKAGHSETGADSPAIKVGRSANDLKQQQPQTVGSQRSKTSIRKQNTSKTSGRLSRVGHTFG
jgi:hypothetical protein